MKLANCVPEHTFNLYIFSTESDALVLFIFLLIMMC